MQKGDGDTSSVFLMSALLLSFCFGHFTEDLDVKSRALAEPLSQNLAGPAERNRLVALESNQFGKFFDCNFPSFCNAKLFRLAAS